MLISPNSGPKHHIEVQLSVNANLSIMETVMAINDMGAEFTPDRRGIG
jgi:hypothetical protein